MGWVGIATGGLLWPLAFIWAFTTPKSANHVYNRMAGGPVVSVEYSELRANHQQHSLAGCQAPAIADRLSEHRVERPAGGRQRSCDVLQLRSQAAFLRRSVEAAKGALRIAPEQYEQGATSFTTVLTAEQNLFQAENTLAGASANVRLGLTAVFRALGGGWQIREGGNFVSPPTVDQMRARTDWGNLLPPTNAPQPPAPGLPGPEDIGPTIRPLEW